MNTDMARDDLTIGLQQVRVAACGQCRLLNLEPIPCSEANSSFESQISNIKYQNNKMCH